MFSFPMSGLSAEAELKGSRGRKHFPSGKWLKILFKSRQTFNTWNSETVGYGEDFIQRQ